MNNTIFDVACGLNSKQLEFLSLKVLALEQTVVTGYGAEPIGTRTIWGLIKEPVVGEGSACKIKKRKFRSTASEAFLISLWYTSMDTRRTISHSWKKEKEKEIEKGKGKGKDGQVLHYPCNQLTNKFSNSFTELFHICFLSGNIRQIFRYHPYWTL